MSETEQTSREDTDGAEYLKLPGFHRRFTLPATVDHGALEVSYSDLGRQPTESDGQASYSPPTILFMPGMYASRYSGALLDVIGKKIGVRILTVDRPGIGYSAQVQLEDRIGVWIELVPKLLAHLGIQHVSLVSHSAGTIYLLNTLYSCQDILSPTRPYVALLAPWVDVKHSGVMMLQAAQLIPSIAFGLFDKVVKSIDANIAPVIDSSFGSVSKWMPASMSASEAAPPKMSENRRRWIDDYGASIEFLDSILDASVSAMCTENTMGVNDETRLCLKKGGDARWGECEDFQLFVEKLAELERQSAREAKLKIKIYFGENDSMIGDKGRGYMQTCWSGKDDEFADAFDFVSITVKDSDHNNLLTLVAVLEEIVSAVAGLENAADTTDS